MKFHAVMIDETGCEFGHSFEAENREAAWEYLGEEFPEPRCVQLEDEAQGKERERRTQEWAERCYEDPYYEIDHAHEWGD
jgi:hypothetical protein